MIHRYKKVVVHTLLCAIVFVTFFGSFQKVEASIDLVAESAILVDANTGKVLFEKNADVMLPPASMSKMMTEYLVLEAIHKGTIMWDQTVPINSFVSNMSHQAGSSNVFLDPEEMYTVKDLYEAMAIESGNAATIALAEVIAGGSYATFVERMNEKAEELELDDYSFVNSTGLPNRSYLGQHVAGNENDENRLSARATAKLAFHLINDFPEMLDTASIPMQRFQGEVLTDVDTQACLNDWTCMKNWNEMLPGLKHEYDGMLGLKTGYTNEAGYCFTGVAEKNGVTLISVVMRLKDLDDRFTETQRLLDYGFNNFNQYEVHLEDVFEEGVTTLPVVNGKAREVKVTVSEPLKVLLKSGDEEFFAPLLELDPNLVTEDGELIAPIEQGEVIGTLTAIHQGDTEYSHLYANAVQHEIVQVETAEAVERAGFFSRGMRGVGGFISNVWTNVADTVKGWFN
ncbi:D-alanyl-D-alanine carboxypeptidase family protein [Alkalihalobacterium alkalinitrilicum]|uniref:D-alanyl-D-alanine carboxypeptidase family protein n=1 Tax=Alkalihalobacterium alkalinitrilicum TaxID=427920 RepID=UPI000995861E|nr:D-alanyl-D-alanine carboxypeptidase family protein [Alkalihalobacterium alkalinitrilicum]